MRVLNYLELENRLVRSGIGTAATHQRKALASTDIDVITSPWNTNAIVDGFDVAHLNLFGPGSLGVATLSRYRNTPLILHAHVTSEDFRESYRGSNILAEPLRRYLQWFYSQADLVLCPSEHTKSLLEAYPVNAPIESVTNGVDHESLHGFEEYRDSYREQFDLDGVVVFTVGNVFERKGLSEFCSLAQTLDYEFVWFGPYDTGIHGSSAVRRWVRNPPENVTFTGWIDDKRGAFGAGDIFLFPTWAENQGLVVLEAMACGKAVVLRDIPVFREFYESGTDCLMCSSHEEFRMAITRLAENPGLREKLGENAQKTAAKHSLDTLHEHLTAVYDRVANN